MKKEYKTTVRARVAKHVVVTLLCSIILVSAVNMIYMSRRVAKGQQRELSMATELCALKVDAWTNELRGITVDLSDTFRAIGKLEERPVKTILNQIAATHPDLIFLYVATEDGHMYMARGVNYATGVDPRQRGWYQMAKEARRTILTDPYISATRPDLMLATAATPIYVDGELIGIVGVDADVSTINEYINSMDFDNGSYGFLLDSQNNIVAHNNKNYQPTVQKVYSAVEVMPELQEILDSPTQEGLADGRDYKNESVVYSVSKLGLSDWKVGIAYSQRLLYRTIDRGIRISLFIAIICIFFAAGEITIAIKRILRPIEKINPAIDKILAGDFTAHLNISKKQDELGEVQDKLSAMIKMLSKMVEDQKHIILEMEKGNLTVEDMPELPGDMKEVSQAVNSIKETFNDIISDIQFSAINLQSFAMGINETSDLEEMRLVFEELSAEANILMEKTSRFITLPPEFKADVMPEEEDYSQYFEDDYSNEDDSEIFVDEEKQH